MRVRRDAGRVAADEAPEHRRVLGIRHRDEVEQHRERDRRGGLVAAAGKDDLRLRRRAGMDVPDRIAETRLRVLLRIAAEEGEVVVDVARDDVEE